MELTDSQREILRRLVTSLDELDQLWDAGCDMDQIIGSLADQRERIRRVFLGD